jgi:hypothetical protein
MKTAQQAFAPDRRVLALACVGYDMIKVWPLPVQQPWFEHPLDPTMGQWASRQDSH